MSRKLLLGGVLVLFVLAIFLRFYNLGAIPLGLNKDETAIGYNAYAILETGKDEHNVQTPLYFKSFNDFKLPVYIYLTAASEKVFGVTPFAVRFPSAIFGLITIIALFFLIKLTSKRLDLAIVAALMLAFNPWQFFFSRTAFEVNVAVSFAVLGSLFFVLAVHKKGNILLLVLAMLTFGLSLYSYNVTRIFAPLLLTVLVILHHKEIYTWSKLSKVAGGILGVIIILPLLLTFGNTAGTVNPTSGVFLNGALTKAQQTEFRSYMLTAPDIYVKLFFNSYVLTFWEYCRNIIQSFSTNFFFMLGPKSVNGIANHGVLYPFELITIVIGLYVGWKRKERYLRYFFLWLALEIAVIALTQEVPHPTRSFLQVIPLTVFSAYGAINIWSAIKNIRPSIAKYFLQFGAICIVGYALLTYFTAYFFVFPVNQAKVWRSAEAELSAYLAENENKYDRIIIDPKTDFSYTALVFYTKLSPEIYQKSVTYKQDGLLLSAAKIGKYEFAPIDWQRYSMMEKTLIITTIDGFKDKPVFKTFSYPTRHIVSNVNGELISYPFEEPAYVLIESQK